ncbi:helix-turn-helix domain-containing protein [Peptacetobacter sp. AB800]|uniref:helix-turn-helix domain-containing protein n=1 Tax=Peptacetobacter sp. AB800 TaxID=3388428 RepID=UPI0039FBAD0C
MSFGDILKQLRTEQNLNQTELADKIGISRSSIAMYETNQRTPDYETINALSDFFNVSSDYLLGRTSIRNFEENTIAAHMDDRTKTLSEEQRKRLDDFIDFLIFEEMKKNND